MAISFSGISTGADWTSIINDLLEVQSDRLYSLQDRQGEVENQISDYGRVRSLVDGFMSSMEDLLDESTMAGFAGSSTDESVVTVSANSSAAVSTYDIVVSQLASRDKIASSAYADSSTAVGTGTLSITVNGQTMDLTVDSGNNTLIQLAAAINNASDNPGVTASILNETGGSRLVLTSDDTGADNAITINVTDDDGNNTDASGLSMLFYIGAGGDGYAEQVSSAQNALLTIDGFNVESASNAVSDAVTGVTLNLTDTGSATVNIERDNTDIEDKASQFVTSYNLLMDELDSYQEGTLANDSSLRRMEQGFVDILAQAANLDGSDRYLFEIGIERDKYGRLSLDTAVLSQALADDFSSVARLFGDDTQGYATRLYNLADSLLEVGGIIDSKEDSLDSIKDRIENSIEREEYRLDIVEQSLIKQFAALDQTLALLSSTSTYLTNQLNAINSSSS
ncbi:MAG: flagellar filament capping protein FliD [Candidatus Thiodiazotropha sp.]|jgi:flagellar hook-associated protein 2